MAMKTQKWIGLCGSLAFLVAAIFGCEQEEPPIPPHVPPFHVQVYVYADTLLTYPSAPHGDVPGFAWVVDRQERVARGVVVDLAATPPPLGYIELADSVLRDTTNECGRVEFWFHSTGVPGEVHITAGVGTISSACTLAVVESHRYIRDITITLGRSQLGYSDSTLVTACVRDTSGAGIPGVSILLSMMTGGRIGRFDPPNGQTDSTGCSRCWWWPDCCGRQCLYWRIGEVLDSACVTVDSL
jgi:hypothetical protein